MKPPLLFHSRAYQRDLLRSGTRERIIEWLVWNDPNGTYTDTDSAADGMPALSLERAKQIMNEQAGRDRQIS